MYMTLILNVIEIDTIDSKSRKRLPSSSSHFTFSTSSSTYTLRLMKAEETSIDLTSNTISREQVIERPLSSKARHLCFKDA